MASDGIQIDSAALKGAGGQLQQVADRFIAEFDRFAAEMAGYGAPWGGDDIGSLIGAAYQEVSSYAFECFGEAIEELGVVGADLDGMGQRYEQVETAIAEDLRGMTGQLGG
jgi:hypothetical protein